MGKTSGRGRGEACDLGLNLLSPGGQWFPLVTRHFPRPPENSPEALVLTPPRAPGPGAVTRGCSHERRWQFLKQVNVCVSHGQIVPLPSIYPGDVRADACTTAWPSMNAHGSSPSGLKAGCSQCPLTDEGTGKLWDMHTRGMVQQQQEQSRSTCDHMVASHNSYSE